jgi:hypothetical protein
MAGSNPAMTKETHLQVVRKSRKMLDAFWIGLPEPLFPRLDEIENFAGQAGVGGVDRIHVAVERRSFLIGCRIRSAPGADITRESIGE